ncbi:MAG: hypothetical protein ACLTAI_13175 [Thomasclavelia sp.]
MGAIVTASVIQELEMNAGAVITNEEKNIKTGPYCRDYSQILPYWNHDYTKTVTI